MKKISMFVLTGLLTLTPLTAHATSDNDAGSDNSGKFWMKAGGTKKSSGTAGTPDRVRNAKGISDPEYRCTWEKISDDGPLSHGGDEASWGNLDGAYWRVTCPGEPPRTVWVPATEGGAPAAIPGIPTVTPRMLALQALREAQLPYPDIATSPPPGTPLLVRLPTWWWVPNNTQPVTHRVAVGPFWAEVTATPSHTRWITSDGTINTCRTLGIPWHEYANESDACTVTYLKPTDLETARIQTIWTATWRGSGGTGGDLGTQVVESAYEIPVYERQVIGVHK